MSRALCALFVLCALSWPTSADNAKSLTTILIVAPAELPDTNFKNSVVLVMNHIGPAPAGVIINRPTTIGVSRLFPDLERLAQLDDKLYFGGPVDLSTVSFLFRAETPPEHATEVLGGVYMSTNRDLLRKLLGREKPMEGLRNLHWLLGLVAGSARGGDRTRRLEARARQCDHDLRPKVATPLARTAACGCCPRRLARATWLALPRRCAPARALPRVDALRADGDAGITRPLSFAIATESSSAA